ncbi:MAG: hypothetical protein NCW75_04130 [Phycisphaera sp.]|nr:MAG: hypothetical protein NCW75_04130 [Phycisphaera sp.]
MTEISENTFRAAVDHETAQSVSQMLADTETLDDVWHLYGLTQGASATGEDPVDTGKRTFVRRLQELRAIFCANPSIRAIVHNPALDKEIDLATVLAGVLLHQQYPGTQVAVIAVLVAKIGVIRLCSETYMP